MMNPIKVVVLLVGICLGTDVYARDIVNYVQENPINVNTSGQSASKALRRTVVKKGWMPGWDEQNKRFLSIGSYAFDCQDPSAENNFLGRRNIAAKISVLEAKAQIIEFMNTTVSAEQLLTIPDSPASVKFQTEHDYLSNKLNIVAIKIAKVSGSYLNELSSTDLLMSEKFDLIANIASSDTNNKIKKYCDKFITAYDEFTLLLSKVEDFKQDTLTQSFSDSISTLAKQILLGCVTLKQFESWDAASGKYEVATLTAWSPKLERDSRTILAGGALTQKNKNHKGDVFSWLDKQNFAHLIGSRVYVDGEGQRWFIGVGVRELKGSARMAQKKAEMDSKKSIAFGLYADVESQKMASTYAETHQEVNASEKTSISESFAQTLSQKVENKSIRGMMKLEGKEVTHPISQKKLLVEVWGVKPSTTLKSLGGMSKTTDVVNSSNFNNGSVSSTVQLSAPAVESLEAAYSRLVKRGSGSATGYNKNDGAFFIVLSSMTVDGSLKPQQYSQMIQAIAQKDVASFLKQDISALEVNKEQSNSTGEIESTFKSMVRIGVNQCLKGAQFLGLKVVDNKYYCGYALTQRGMQTAQALSNPTVARLDAKEGPKVPGDKTVTAVGMAVITSGNVADAQQAALNEAQKNAVSQVLGTLLSSTTQVKDMSSVKSKIFTNTVGFINSYRVTEEGITGTSYTVKIIAEVAKNKIFDSYSSMLKTMGDPEFYVDADGDNELREKFSTFFEELGFKVVGQKSLASYVIRLRGKFARLKHPIEKTEGTQLSLWIKMFSVDTHKLIFSIKNDPRKAAIFYGDSDRQHDLTVKKSFKQIKKPLHEKINKAISGMVQSGRTVLVHFDGYSESYDECMRTIADILDGIPGVSDIKKHSVNAINQEYTFGVTYSGKIETLEDMMMKDISSKIQAYQRPSLRGIKTNKISLAFD